MKKPLDTILLDKIVDDMESKMPVPCMGRISGADENGRVLVTYGEDVCRPARLGFPLNRYELASAVYLGREVLLNFADGDPDKPIIVVLMDDPLEDLTNLTVKEKKPHHVQVDGKTIAIDAHDEIIFKCGPGSIHLTKEGTIILKGIEIISRARDTNKIKGGKVEAN